MGTPGTAAAPRLLSPADLPAVLASLPEILQQRAPAPGEVPGREGRVPAGVSQGEGCRAPCRSMPLCTKGAGPELGSCCCLPSGGMQLGLGAGVAWFG